jgi:hypothetical protein
MFSSWALIPVAVLATFPWWFVRTAERQTLWCCTFALSAFLATLPLLSDRASVFGLGVLVLISAAALPVKLIDCAVVPQVWTGRPWHQWVSFLLLPFVVCFRGHLRDLVRPRSESARLILRGLFEMAAGAALLRWAFLTDWSTTSLIAEHITKLMGFYLLVLDGAFVLATGLLQVSGFAIHDLSANPIFADTPADFWRRYNRDAGRFLFENVFRKIPLRSLKARIVVVFLANGALHEYLVWLMCGRILGYFIAFFALQGIAAALTARYRPTGVAALVSWLATLIFMLASSGLVMASVNAFVPWFQHR